MNQSESSHQDELGSCRAASEARRRRGRRVLPGGDRVRSDVLCLDAICLQSGELIDFLPSMWMAM
ncbi:hypothetical protein EYF80_008576 [Liparis tanakae]|uniref:Uncharacterized protein n=1 Tax=Liparis tanakae TaxID=230148 RepID=A0A4Z2IVE5_9TELE|nr:hypothetical protein EYF80_008576 [Liparis tanakae]